MPPLVQLKRSFMLELSFSHVVTCNCFDKCISLTLEADNVFK